MSPRYPINSIAGAINSLYFAHLDKLPEQFDLFFHPNEAVKSIARRAYSGTSRAAEEVVLNQLIAVLNNPQRVEDQLDVIWVIATKAESTNNSGRFGGTQREVPRKEQVIEQLQELLVNGDPSLLVGTIVALGRLTADSGPLVIKAVDDRVSAKRKAELSAAAKTVEARGEGEFPGGGGFGGGHGDGFF